ncbi:MAG: Ldh family oxidoreductase, partial [Clostridiales bacterium]|nr:Ldh family oxidoreductase [Clostridiales bacterium]
DIAAFTEPDVFRQSAGGILRELRASRKAPGQDRIYTAGEKEYLAWIERREHGVPLNKAVRQSLEAARTEYNVPCIFSWEQK